jgi:hypothetical protein
MNPRLDHLASLVKDRQAQMRQEARLEAQLRLAAEPDKAGWTMRHKFVLALAAAALLAFAVAEAANAAAGAGGGGGSVFHMM